MQYENSQCSRCRTFPEEWLDEDGKAKDPEPFVVESKRCRGCVVLDEEHRHYESQGDTRGLYLYLVPSSGA